MSPFRKNVLHASIDLETLSLESNAVITSIGIIVFELYPGHYGIHNTAHILVDPSTIPPIQHASLETLQWRENHGGIAWGKTSYKDMLREVAEELEGVTHLWGHGKDADLVWLAHSYRALMFPLPPSLKAYYNTLDTRTHFANAEFDYVTWRKSVIDDSKRHDALVDAQLQADGIAIAYNLTQSRKLFGVR